MAPERPTTPQGENLSIPVMSVPASPVAGFPVQNAQSPISILLAVAQSQSMSDDDLTNLNWLHEHDLLKGMNIDPSPLNSVNGTSDKNYDNNNASTVTPLKGCSEVPNSVTSYSNSSATCLNQSTGAPRNKHPTNIPYDPFIHTDNKPPYSFSCLIFMAIEDSDEKALPVKEIYAWIVNHFPYFKKAPMGWKNSVRHNLSLNKCFRKVEKAANLGKGSLWTIDPQYKPTLIQALNRSPITSMSTINKSLESLVNKSFASPPPDRDSFSFSARELAANGISELDRKGKLEAVDAAAVMLSLKNGTSYKNIRRNPQAVMTFPSQDHTYSSADGVTSNEGEQETAECAHFRVPRNCNCQELASEDDEEQRIKEGAETLLNLAGVTFRKRHFDSNDRFEDPPRKQKKYPQFDINENETKEVICTTSRLPRAKKRDDIGKLVSYDEGLVNSRQKVVYKEDR